MSTRRNRAEILQLVLLTILCLLELIAVFSSDVSGVDGPSQLNLESQFNALVRAGEWLPRWTPLAFGHFGAPSFYFYPPFAFYLAAGLSIITHIVDPVTLFKIVAFVMTLTSIATSYTFFRAIEAEKRQAIFAGILYACGPFRLAELYSRSSLSSHVAYALLPLVFCGAVLLVKNPKWGVLLFGSSLAVLLVTSVPLVVVALIGVILIAIATRRELMARTLLYGVVSAAFASALSAWFWMRVLTARSLVQLNYLLAQREFFLDDLLQFKNLPGLYHVAILLSATLLIVVWRFRYSEGLSNNERRTCYLALVLGLLILVFEIPPVGRTLLVHAPGLSLMQGTWRLYILPYLLVCSFIAIAHSPSACKVSHAITIIILVAALPLAVLASGKIHLFPHTAGPATDPPEYAPIYTLHDNIQLQRIVNAHREDPPLLMSNGNATFHQFYWPYWHLLDGSREIITRPDSIGRVVTSFDVSRDELHWVLEKSPLERAGLWVSGIAWGVLLFFAMPMLLIQHVRRKEHLT